MLIFIFPFQAQILFIWPVTTICFTVGSKFEATYITGWLCPTLVDNSQFQFVLVAADSQKHIDDVKRKWMLNTRKNYCECVVVSSA